MRNFFYRLSSALARFMYGRNGADQLGNAMLVLYLVFWLLEVLLDGWTEAENQWILRWWLPLKGRLRGARERRQDREHRYFTCKSCGTICRVPAGKGKIEITCPKCGSKAIDKLQRITGYLVGTTDRWNNAKLAELADRVVHK